MHIQRLIFDENCRLDLCHVFLDMIHLQVSKLIRVGNQQASSENVFESKEWLYFEVNKHLKLLSLMIYQ